MTDPLRLDGKVAFVTGGAGDGIGLGLSTVLLERGASVAIADIDEPRAQAAAQELSRRGGARAFALDVRSDTSVRGAIAAAEEAFGGLDILVNNAGVGLVGRIHEFSPEEYQNLLDVNLTGIIRCCCHARDAMRRRGGGVMLNISSVHATATLPGFSFYASTKAAVVGFTRGLALDLGEEGIRANAILPGLVDCSQTRRVLAQTSPDVDAWIDRHVKRFQAIPERVTARDVGFLAAFLASDAARAITGAVIPIDAGSLALLAGKDS